MLRTVLLLWGVNKFTKKLREADPIPTNEIDNLVTLDFDSYSNKQNATNKQTNNPPMRSTIWSDLISTLVHPDCSAFESFSQSTASLPAEPCAGPRDGGGLQRPNHISCFCTLFADPLDLFWWRWWWWWWWRRWWRTPETQPLLSPQRRLRQPSEKQKRKKKKTE